MNDVQKNNSFTPTSFQCFSEIIDWINHNYPTMHFGRANTDLGVPIRIHKGKFGFRRANTELSMVFRKANTKSSLGFRRANTEKY